MTTEYNLKIKAHRKNECASSVGREGCVCVRWAAAPVGAAAVGAGCIDLRGARAPGGGGRAAGTSPPLARHPRSPQPAAHRDCRRTLRRQAAPRFIAPTTFDIQSNVRYVRTTSNCLACRNCTSVTILNCSKLNVPKTFSVFFELKFLKSDKLPHDNYFEL